MPPWIKGGQHNLEVNEMKLFKLMAVSAIATLISTSVWAQAADGDSSVMPMQGAMPHDMDPQMMEAMRQRRMQMMSGDQQAMDPQMMQRMMQMRQQQMGQGNMPMMGQGQGQMSPQMMERRHQMMQMRQQQMQQNMGKGMQGGNMNPQMMQNMMEMRQQHKQQMEQRLANIESMLAELLALQKQK